jgi:predicted DCC family thiol-disulfide oxidoreductase YuxK
LLAATSRPAGAGEVVKVAALLLFDGECRFSSSCARAFQRAAKPSCIVLPHQRVDLDRWQVSLPLAAAAVVFVERDGRTTRVRAGAPAIAEAMATGRFPWPAAGAVLSAPLVAQAAQAVYRVVASNRHRLPGGTPACDLDRAEAAVGADEA